MYGEVAAPTAQSIQDVHSAHDAPLCYAASVRLCWSLCTNLPSEEQEIIVCQRRELCDTIMEYEIQFGSSQCATRIPLIHDAYPVLGPRA